MQNLIFEMDKTILLYIQEFLRFDFLTPIMKLMSALGDYMGVFWIMFSIMLIVIPKTRKIGLISLCSVFLSIIINNGIIKSLVGRERPFYHIPELIVIGNNHTSFSFPSGHTGRAFASAVVIYRKSPFKYGCWLIILASLIGYSRLYLGVHYPTDVIFGIVSGILYSYIAEWLIERGTRIWTNQKKYK